jgi:hypothetical protein
MFKMFTKQELCLETIEAIQSKFRYAESELEYLGQSLESHWKNNKASSLVFVQSYVLNQLVDLKNRTKDQLGILLNWESYCLDSLIDMQVVDEAVDDLLAEIRGFANLINQRVIGIELEDPYYFSPSFEVSSMQKVFSAVDILTFSYFQDIMGEAWLDNERCFPMCFFCDEATYSINAVSKIVRIPVYDGYRCRFWPQLAHEVAHIKLREMWGNKYENTPSVIHNLAVDVWQNLEVLPQNAITQIRELCCDWIATLIAGPAYTLAMLTSFGKPESRRIAYSYKNVMSHPPNDVRNLASSKILEANGLSVLNIIDQVQQEKDSSIRESARTLSASVDPADRSKAAYMSEDWKFLKIYKELISEDFSRINSQLASYFQNDKLYNASDWEDAKKCFKSLTNNEAVETSPVQILNAAWLKRDYSSQLYLGSQHGENTVRSFRNYHKYETKLYGPIVESLLRYSSRIETRLLKTWS